MNRIVEWVRRHPRAAVIAIALPATVVLAVAAGSALLSSQRAAGVADPTPTASAVATLSQSVEPSSTPSPTESPTLSPSPSPADPPPPEPGWEEIGVVGDGFVDVVKGFQGGYVAARSGTPSELFFSTDGATWEPTTLFEDLVSCPVTEAEFTLRAWVTHAASNGREVLLAGGTLSATTETCASSTATPGPAIAWLSADGRSWTQSQPFARPGDTVMGVWSTADGWFANVHQGLDPQQVTWYSADGLAWQQAGPAAGIGAPSDAGPDGTRLWWTKNDNDEVVLLRSADGRTWRELEVPFPALPMPPFGEVTIEPPGPGASTWLVITQSNEGVVGWTSPDLQAWERLGTTEIGTMTDAVPIAGGHLVAGSICRPDVFDAPCLESQRQYRHVDGEGWSALDTPLLELWAVDRGPAGVIAIQMDGSVWRLQP